MIIESFSIGNSHYDNEDRLVVKEIGTLGLTAVLADGMGGLSLGGLAAEVVSNAVAGYIKNNYQGSNEKIVLHDALNNADSELRETCIANKSNMGTAIAAVIVHRQHLFCTWQGNVRIYILHHDKLRLITQDHIAHIGHGRTALTRCIKGAGLRDDLPFVCYELADKDVIYLCTDGMYNVVEGYMLSSSVDEMKVKIGLPEDDASLIKISQ